MSLRTFDVMLPDNRCVPGIQAHQRSQAKAVAKRKLGIRGRLPLGSVVSERAERRLASFMKGPCRVTYNGIDLGKAKDVTVTVSPPIARPSWIRRAVAAMLRRGA